MNTSIENKLYQASVSEIKRIHKPTPDEFKDKILPSRQPVIITGEISKWKAFSSWSIDYLNSVVGDKEIIVNVSKNKIFTFDPEAGFVFHNTKMKFTDFMNWILKEEKAGQRYYLQQSPIKISFPELLKDIEIPKDYIRKKLLFFIFTSLWIGTDGNISPLHYDIAENLLAQVRGRKRILLFDPEQTSLLYPFPAYSKTPHMSQLNIDEPDIDKFPEFQKAKYIECILEPGEMLFIPAFWWHQVYSLDQLNISISFWWNPNFREFFTPSGRRSLAEIPYMIWDTIKDMIG